MVLIDRGSVKLDQKSYVILDVLEEALSAADPLPKLAGFAEGLRKRPTRRAVLAVGKAAQRMFSAFKGIGEIELVVSNVRSEGGIEAGHPFPDYNSYDAARMIYSILKNLGPEDEVVFLISGGASSLVGDYVFGPKKIKELTVKLMNSGANIYELNVVRKHLSYLKGGRAAKITQAKVRSYIVSDVIGDDLSTIASGLTAPDDSTFEDAIEVLERYGVEDEDVYEALKNPEKHGLTETVKRDEFPYERVENLIVCRNSDSLAAAQRKAEELGFRAVNLGTTVKGNVRDEAERLYRYFEGLREGQALISGGEPTVKVKGRGVGGRNQELVLSLLEKIREKEVIASVGTDGIDGPTDAAGAVADWTTKERASALGLSPKEYLEENNSYEFFRRVGGLIKTGPTGTNVMDVQVMIKL